FVPIYVACVATSRGLARLFWIFALAAGVAVLIMTASRSGLFGLVVGGTLGTYLYRRYLPVSRMVGWTAVALIALVPVLLVIGGAYGEMFVERLVGQTSLNVGYASSGRTDIWQRAFEVMADHPWSFVTGLGWGMWDASSFEF